MAATGLNLTYAVVIADVEHWSPEHRAQAAAAGGYDDWVFERLDAVMRAAGEQFIREHPDLFAVNELI